MRDPGVANDVPQHWAQVPHIERGDVAPRESQPCWCPDAMRDYSITVDYCPRHGATPDPELWDYTADAECNAEVGQ